MRPGQPLPLFLAAPAPPLAAYFLPHIVRPHRWQRMLTQLLILSVCIVALHASAAGLLGGTLGGTLGGRQGGCAS